MWSAVNYKPIPGVGFEATAQDARGVLAASGLELSREDVKMQGTSMSSLTELEPVVRTMPTGVRGRRLSIVVPCYNEEEVFPETLTRLRALLDRMTDSGKIDPGSEIVFVDDGSKDATWSLVRGAHQADHARVA